MAEDFKRVKFDRGAFLIKEGERTDDAYLIAKGKVEIRIGAFGRNPHTWRNRAEWQLSLSCE